jgi:DNA-binding CsgD family transcriptional regulator
VMVAPICISRQSPAQVTPREAAVLALAHLQVRDIAKALNISPWTVKAHLKSIFVKLGAETRTQAVLAWQERRAA